MWLIQVTNKRTKSEKKSQSLLDQSRELKKISSIFLQGAVVFHPVGDQELMIVPILLSLSPRCREQEQLFHAFLDDKKLMDEDEPR